MRIFLFLLLCISICQAKAELPEWDESDTLQKYHCVETVDGETTYMSCQDTKRLTYTIDDFHCYQAEHIDGKPFDGFVCVSKSFNPENIQDIVTGIPYEAVYKGTDLCVDPEDENLPLWKNEEGVDDSCSIPHSGEYHEWIVPEDDGTAF